MTFNSKYQITSLGFLPDACIKILPSPLANTHLQTLVDNLPISDGHKYRALIESMIPDSSIEDYLASAPREEAWHIYTVLSMISQKYVWGCGPDHLLPTLPKQIGLPLLSASEKVGLPPVFTYASSVLWNWSLRDPTKPFCLDNLKLNYKILEGTSFEWFFIVHVAIEGLCGHIADKMMATKDYMRKGNNEAIKEVIREVMQATKIAQDTLMRMREHCVPEDFWEFRMYLSGTQDPVFFPKGLQVEGVEGTNLSFRGASGTQSSLIQAFDCFYSIKHGDHEESFINETKAYMPPAHRQYLKDLASGVTLREYVGKSNDEDLKRVFSEGVATLERFRKSHISIVHSYIVKFMKPKKEETPTSKKEVNVFGENGSGGTNFRILLNNIVQATTNGKELNKIEEVSAEKGNKEKIYIKKTFSTQKGNIMLFLISIMILLLAMLAFKVARSYISLSSGVLVESDL